MKWQDVLAVLAVAGVTMAFTLTLLGPTGVGAGDAVPAIKPEIAQPQLTSQGCVFSLKMDKAAYEAGEQPALEITASNPTDKPVDATVWVNISASSPANRMSRMMVVPAPLWSHECRVNLQPGERKTITIASEAKLPAGQSISISLTDKNAAMLLRNLSVQNTLQVQGQQVQAPAALFNGRAQ
jgi:hypothetical protein